MTGSPLVVHRIAVPSLLLALSLLASCRQRATQPFDVVEASIDQIHDAMAAGDLTAVQLVDDYLARIAAYDKQGPALNAIIVVNPRARERAAELDSIYAATGEFVGPLHGIPVIVKDNYDTHDLPTTAGSLSLDGSIPPDDAYQVRKIRQAGAIVLAKSNMAEFAFSPYETVGSELPGYTRNPYATNRTTAGSSGGTAAAVAASFGAVGLGTDTGNSIRGPSSHQALVGIRSTHDLTSRDGIVPLYEDRDVGGPIARTVADAVAVLDVIAGTDPADPYTTHADEHVPAGGYEQYLDPDGLKGTRIGIARQLSDDSTADPETMERFRQAVADLRARGAVVVDSAMIPGYDTLITKPLFCRRFRPDINAYLASLGPNAPVKSLEDIIDSGRYHPTIAQRLRYMAGFPASVGSHCDSVNTNAAELREAVLQLMDDQRLDALIYPTWNNPPRLIGDLNTPDGNNSWKLSPPTGFPAITVPMGFVKGDLPVGLQIFGRAWSEPTLIRIAYGYEQATHRRHPPATTPPLSAAR
jgi:amidase